jgi:hypothetical protein
MRSGSSSFGLVCWRSSCRSLRILGGAMRRIGDGCTRCLGIKWLDQSSKVELDFSDLEVFNKALLARQAWRLIQYPYSLCARLLKAKYYPSANLLDTIIYSKCVSHLAGYRAFLYGGLGRVSHFFSFLLFFVSLEVCLDGLQN